jgi:hypothetical protein
MSLIQTATAAQQLDVRRAQQAVREAEEKLALLKKWNRELENRTAPLVKQVEQLQGFLSADLTKAVAYLAQVVKTLEAYASVSPGGGETPAAAPASGEAPPAEGNAAPSAESGARTTESARTDQEEPADIDVRAPEGDFPEPERRTPIRQVPLAGDHANPETGTHADRGVGQRQHADSEIGAPADSPEPGGGNAPEGGAA